MHRLTQFWAVLMLFGMSTLASAASLVCREPGLVVIRAEAIARWSNSYFLVQLPRGITRQEADDIAANCRYLGKVPFLFSPDEKQEWLDVKGRFGTSLKGVPNVEHAWVWARISDYDRFFRWRNGSLVSDTVPVWGAYAPKEPGSRFNDALAFHAEYPGQFNALDSRSKITRIMLEVKVR